MAREFAQVCLILTAFVSNTVLRGSMIPQAKKGRAMSIVEEYSQTAGRSFPEAPATQVEIEPWGARLREPEVNMGIFIKSAALYIGAFALVCLAVLQWAYTFSDLTAEMALIKLGFSALAMAGALMLWHYAQRTGAVTFEIDANDREVRTVLDAEPQIVLERTAFDTIDDVYVARREGHYVLAIAQKTGARAEVLAHGTLPAMQNLQTLIQRAVA